MNTPEASDGELALAIFHEKLTAFEESNHRDDPEESHVQHDALLTQFVRLCASGFLTYTQIQDTAVRLVKTMDRYGAYWYA